MRLALDTNVLVYAEGLERASSGAAKCARAAHLLDRAADESLIVARQSLAELHAVLVRRGRRTPAQASRDVLRWQGRAQVVETDAAVFAAALMLASDHGIGIFDAIILAAAAEGRCDLLLSEDFQEGFAWRRVEIANPFARSLNPRLKRLL